MTIKIITNFHTLCRLARKEANSKKNGTEGEIKKAKEEHEAYKKLCLEADGVFF
jgi:hypothetical protein